ncbi:MAG: hypothetical protein DHS20C09_07380 [marine bacterium B5-7]|nr:MAG: hypothetical protein DHS20C09_07380 [marine bacterium B5-7]
MSLYIQSMSFARGYAWIAEAWPYFTRNPLGWIAAMVVFFLIAMVVSIIPLGGIVLNIFYPVVVGGFMLGCIAHREGGSFEFQYLFAGFKDAYLKRLAMLGVFYTIITFAVIVLIGVLAFVMLGGFEFFQEIEQAQIEDVSAYATDIMLLSLIAVTLFTPCVMAIWFAPIIIISSDETTISAMLLSFNACLKNIFPFLLYGMVVFILAIIASIPLMLGYLVLLPVLSASVYVSYLDCFKSDISDDPTQLLPR